LEIKDWLAKDCDNVVMLQCYTTLGRSALIFSCLMKVLRIYNHPGEGITHFSNKVKCSESEVVFPTQNIYLQYFNNICDGFDVMFIDFTFSPSLDK